MKNRLSILLLLLSGSFWATAQSTITGKLADSEGLALPYATVALLHAADSSLAKGAITNEQGAYELVGIKAGAYHLQARMMGYANHLSPVISVPENQTKQITTITLVAADEQLEEIVVRGQLPQIVQEAERMVVNVENSSLSTGGNALEVLEKSPGIIVDQDGNISMNGKQGIIIMIDGKRTFLSATEVSNMLRNMSSEAVAKIELITNPGAKYDAEGNAGIINIQTKKKLAGGTNGNVSVGAGYGKFEKYNAGLTLNHRNGSWNYFGSYNYNFNKNYRNTYIDRWAPYYGERPLFNSENKRVRNNQSNSYKVGVDFFATDKTTLGVAINGYANNANALADNTTRITDVARVEQGLLVQGLKNNATYNNVTYNLNWQQKLKKDGEELLLNADYNRFRSNNYDNFDIDHYDNIVGIDTAYWLFNGSESDIDIYVASLDYTLPLTKGSRLEVGAKSSYVISNNELELKTSPNGENWAKDQELSSAFLYKENLNAVYANWHGKLGETSITAGLRAESTWYDGNADTAQIGDEYIALFPSIFVQHQIAEKHRIGASYSRRVDRPSYQDLNPFIYFLDIFTFGRGNQFLQPSFTNQVQLTYGFNNWLNASFTASKTKDPMTDIIDQEEDGRGYQTNTNLGDLYAWNLNLNASLNPTKWWSMQNNLSIFQNIFDATWRGQELDTRQLAWNYNLQNSIILPAGFKAELGAFYRSPMQYSIIDMKSMYSVFAGISKSFMDDKATLKLNMNDIFNTMQFRGTIDFDDIEANVSNKWESRQARLTFTYRFGSNDSKPVRRQRGASADELSRIKGGE